MPAEPKPEPQILLSFRCPISLVQRLDRAVAREQSEVGPTRVVTRSAMLKKLLAGLPPVPRTRTRPPRKAQ